MRLKSNNHVIPNLKEIYEKYKMKEKKSIEMQEITHAKEEREENEAWRKAVREKMFEKTLAGQPVNGVQN